MAWSSPFCGAGLPYKRIEVLLVFKVFTKVLESSFCPGGVKCIGSWDGLHHLNPSSWRSVLLIWPWRIGEQIVVRNKNPRPFVTPFSLFAYLSVTGTRMMDRQVLFCRHADTWNPLLVVCCQACMCIFQHVLLSCLLDGKDAVLMEYTGQRLVQTTLLLITSLDIKWPWYNLVASIVNGTVAGVLSFLRSAARG